MYCMYVLYVCIYGLIRKALRCMTIISFSDTVDICMYGCSIYILRLQLIVFQHNIHTLIHTVHKYIHNSAVCEN